MTLNLDDLDQEIHKQLEMGGVSIEEQRGENPAELNLTTNYEPIATTQ